MPWAVNTNPVTTPETTALAADRSMLVGAQALDGVIPTWSSDTGIVTDTDRSSALGPGWFAADRGALPATYPTGVATNQWWLVCAISEESELDCWGLFGTNFATIDGGVACVLEIADNLAFTTNLITISTVGMDGPRMFKTLTNRYTGTGFLRVRFDAGADFIPEVGELWIGRRRQLRGFVRTGRDPDGVASVLAIADADAESQGANAMVLGRRELDMAIRTLDNDSNLTDTATLRAWWGEIDRGHKPFLWCREPLSAPNSAVLMTTNTLALVLPRERGIFDRPFAQAWQETPPFLAAEET